VFQALEVSCLVAADFEMSLQVERKWKVFAPRV
jgi:hypothetical protein